MVVARALTPVHHPTNADVPNVSYNVIWTLADSVITALLTPFNMPWVPTTYITVDSAILAYCHRFRNKCSASVILTDSTCSNKGQCSRHYTSSSLDYIIHSGHSKKLHSWNKYIAASFIHLASLFVNINWVECKLSYWVRIEPELLRT